MLSSALDVSARHSPIVRINFLDYLENNQYDFIFLSSYIIYISESFTRGAEITLQEREKNVLRYVEMQILYALDNKDIILFVVSRC